ncbi:MAG TPA: hypothetical protein VGL81_06420 [Polyangiaceae bacterium]|jgi:hypothetical protein
MSVDVSPLERAVIEATLAGDHPILAVLRRQWASARVTSRDFTSFGLYLAIEVAGDAPTVPIARLLFGDVRVELPRNKNAMGSLVVIEEGRLTCLEVYTFDMPWPDDVTGFRTKYVKEPRSFEKVDAAVER